MKGGLEDVVAADTRLSCVDGQRGELIIAGYPLGDLAGRVSFEEVARLLFSDQFERLPDADEFRRQLGAARERAGALIPWIDEQIMRLPPLEAVRAVVARLDDGDDLETALTLLAVPAIVLPALLRKRMGAEPLRPDGTLTHAQDALRMLSGKTVQKDLANALDAYLVTISDHGLNASTFAARVVASTGSGLTSSVIAGLSALKGPLHGGAPGPVLEMLNGIGAPDRAIGWLENALDHGDRLMGFGHRVYKVRDPRADALKRAVKGLASSSAAIPGRLALAESVEHAALDILARRKPGRSLDVNVEFYTALLLEALGFPADAFTAVFACGRVAGWIAHAREQRLTGRLIRPQSRYVGVRRAA